jgi:hypothetical protein
MNKLQQDIIEYLKNTYCQDKEIIESEKNYDQIIKYYNDIQLIYDNCNDVNIKILTPITEKQSTLIDTIYSNINVMVGGFVYVNIENILVDNINILSFCSLYPTIIKFLYQKNIIVNMVDYNLDSYSYLVDNFIILKNNLNIDEYKLLKIIINYKFGQLSKYFVKIGSNTSFIVSSFANVLMNKILELDNKNNILYIDTDSIFYHNAFKVDLIYNMVDNLFRMELELNKTIYFIAKKRYIMFDNINSVKFRGIQIDRFYKDKKLKDLAYDKYCQQNNDLSFREFMSRKNEEIRKFYINREKLRFDRKEKLNQINLFILNKSK